VSQGLDAGAGGQDFISIQVPAGDGVEKFNQRIIAEKHHRHDANAGAGAHLQVSRSRGTRGTFAGVGVLFKFVDL
jgi:hypothetical protein